MSDDDVLRALATARTGAIVDLGHPLRRATSHYPTHVGFELELTRRHGDRVRTDGASSASCTFRMGSHAGTHIDALGHVSHDGRLLDGSDARAASGPDGLDHAGIDEQPPLVVSGVMLDVAALLGVATLDGSHVVTVADLEGAAARQNVVVPARGAVLIRTGWEALWETDAYLEPETPGPDLAAARWLADQGAQLVGSDTAVFEKGPIHDRLPVHTELLMRRRIPIVENLKLSGLAQRGLGAFAFVAAPLAIDGGTGSPLRPLAIG